MRDLNQITRRRADKDALDRAAFVFDPSKCLIEPTFDDTPRRVSRDDPSIAHSVRMGHGRKVALVSGLENLDPLSYDPARGRAIE